MGNVARAAALQGIWAKAVQEYHPDRTGALQYHLGTLWGSNRYTAMTVDEFNAQCMELLGKAREWPDATWEQLEEDGSFTYEVLCFLTDLEDELEQGA